ncbi:MULTISPECIES: class I SAM-dependent methyltransferase [Rhizobium]|uniref:SAM-dependent methyltransferase n=1 Tax=Rhizobium paranaense TaxID=1650438 RepID=A0A7W8XXV5_9HYPH|nr:MULTISPECIES: class I SAM-dependent methyltransferase [Rhizobium]MBB5577537.1 SAM-dependent methyltransferase [Rhizobium paranaense]PST64812.1 class I SAM-dependent methyltransferase [Rhizobium sp. SEMIA4064]
MTGNAEITTAKNWFDKGGSAYALFRPEYPAGLSTFLAQTVGGRGCAVDVGCGNGQLTRQLADQFKRVIGIDPSEDQIANAHRHANVAYLCAPAEQLPLPNGSASLITAAQAAHWFDRPRFYEEARRVADDGAVIALISYDVMRLAPSDLQDRFNSFYHDEIGPYWPPERRLVDSGYSDIEFPFEEISYPEMTIDRVWELGELLGYLSTWSAVRRVNEAGRGDILENFFRDISAIWGSPTSKLPISWPINMRLGKL